MEKQLQARPNKVHCLFEQSGTFKNEFKKLGIEAYDYDILNEFGETDNIVDLFAEIKRAYAGGQTIFDRMDSNDLIMAFFPCTRFEAIIPLAFRGEQRQQRDWSDEKKLQYSMWLQEELTDFYLTLSKLALICLRRDLKLVIENPYTQPHYLTVYWCLKPAVIDKDRTENGDYYKKPTQYFFVNCKPKGNIIFEALDYVDMKVVMDIHTKSERSLIHPQYANRFIRQYLIDEE